MIVLENLRKDYLVAGQRFTALDGVNLRIPRGEICGIIGPSGAGKSTLVRCINRLEEPTSGNIWVDGINLLQQRGAALRQARRKIGMVFQHFNLLTASTVQQNVALPLQLMGWRGRAVRERVAKWLALVGLADHASCYPGQLSGGQKQRVGIARALVYEPPIVLCDEATSALDPCATQAILELLQRLQKATGVTLVVITHEMHVAQTLCQRVAVMQTGRVVEIGGAREIFLQPQHEITRAFARAPDDRVLPPAASVKMALNG